METDIQKTERLIREIKRIHAQYSQDYFETGKASVGRILVSDYDNAQIPTKCRIQESDLHFSGSLKRFFSTK